MPRTRTPFEGWYGDLTIQRTLSGVSAGYAAHDAIEAQSSIAGESDRDVAMAVSALAHMGYRASDAKKMVDIARSHMGPEVSLKDLIVKALHTVPHTKT